MAKIKFSTTRRIQGSKPSDAFSFTTSSVPREAPEVVLTGLQLPGCVVDAVQPSYSTSDLVVSRSGNMDGAYVRVEDPTNVGVDGNRIFLRTSEYAFAAKPFTYYVGTRHGEIAATGYINEAVQSWAEVDGFGTFDYDSLPAACTRLMHTLLDGTTPGAASQDLFLNGGTYSSVPGQASVTPNPDRVLPDLDLSGVSVCRADAGASFPIALISPRHFAVATHVGAVAGQSVTFRRRDGTYQTVTILEVVDRGDDYDMRVGILSEDVTNCEVYSTLPADWVRYMPAMTNQTFVTHNTVLPGMPVITRAANPGTNPGTWTGNVIINTNSPHLLVGWVGGWDIEFNWTNKPRQIMFIEPKGSGVQDPLYPLARGLYQGDSGSPTFVLVPTATGYTPALVGVLFTANSSPFLGSLIGWINMKMAELSATHGDSRTFRMGTVDLSAFKTYE